MENKYNITGIPFILSTLALAFCTFMEVLDFSIANVSVPYIAGGLGVSDSEGTWVITLYMVGNAIVLPISGWLSEKIGAVRLILISSALFGVTSWFCGVAFSFPMLCISRFIQGAVSGPLIPVSQVLLVEIFPQGKKQMAVAIWAMVALIGPIAGPVVGGWITQDFNWRWIFYINIPVSIFSVGVIWAYMKKYIGKVSGQKLDIIGLMLLVIGITSLQILLDKGRQLDWLQSPTIRLLAIISFVCLSILVVYEWVHPDPLINFRILKIRSFTIGTFVLGISFMVFFAPIVITPLWLETYMGYDAFKVGLALATMGILPFLFAPLVGKMMAMGWQKVMIIVSFILMALAFFYFSTFNTSVTFSEIAWSRFLLGIGLTAYIAPMITISLSQVPAEQVARASSILQFFRIFMSGVGVSLYTTLWTDRATFHRSNIVSALTETDSSLSTIKQIALEKFNSVKEPYLEILSRVVDSQAYMLATNDVMIASGLTMLALILLLLWINVSPSEIKKNGLKVGH
ncbi:MAG: Fatty acid resistance protein FarB [Chlamydiae bacterium]|nr:Fatty acid resistance protein FarB [Chlamydiota bacterium]